MLKKVGLYLKKLNKDNRGNIMLFVMVFGSIAFTLIVVGISGYAISENAASRYKQNSEQAFQIAEAGINYYRWHLAHNKNDYQDGTNTAGPYLHPYLDKDGNLLGYYSLNIIPPPTGSTVVTISSTGWVAAQPNSKRAIVAKLGFPSFADYAYITNASGIVDANEVIHGKYHSNGGIQFDGVTDAPVTSAVNTYKCKQRNNKGCDNKNEKKPAIWGEGGPTTFWQYPVPKVDINAAIPKIKQIRDGAKNGGLYLRSSGKQGWRLEFTADGKINVYKVLSTKCYKGKKQISETKESWQCEDVSNLSAPTVYDIPANGYIYVHDRVWVDGVVNGRATIVNDVKNKPIIIDNNLVYAQKDGTDALGLISNSEHGIVISRDAPTDLEIDGVLLTTKNQASRRYFKDNVKNSITIFGSVITFKGWNWNWVDNKKNKVSGYINSTVTYDANLTYAPPPGFPFGTDYNLISWEEVK